jgi:hypothetical protein
VFNDSFEPFNDLFAVLNRGFDVFNDLFEPFNEGFEAFNDQFVAFNGGFAAFNDSFAVFNERFVVFNDHFAEKITTVKAYKYISKQIRRAVKAFARALNGNIKVSRVSKLTVKIHDKAGRL